MSRDGDGRSEMPDPEVVPMAQRRRFSASEKLRILGEAEGCTEPGEIGALVRREGIYSSYLSRWRRARDQGQLTALGAQQPGPKRRRVLAVAARAFSTLVMEVGCAAGGTAAEPYR